MHRPLSLQHLVKLHAHKQLWQRYHSPKPTAPRCQSNSINCLTEGPDRFAHFEESMLGSPLNCRASGEAWLFKSSLASCQSCCCTWHYHCAVECVVWSLSTRSQTAQDSCITQTSKRCMNCCSPYIDCFEQCSFQVFITQKAFT